MKEERNLSPEVFPRISSLADLVKKNIDESRGAKRVFINEILCVRDVNAFSLTGWALAVAHPTSSIQWQFVYSSLVSSGVLIFSDTFGQDFSLADNVEGDLSDNEFSIRFMMKF